MSAMAASYDSDDATLSELLKAFRRSSGTVCEFCGDSASNIKCQTCGGRYCSVDCRRLDYSAHRRKCVAKIQYQSAEADESDDETDSEASDSDAEENDRRKRQSRRSRRQRLSSKGQSSPVSMRQTIAALVASEMKNQTNTLSQEALEDQIALKVTQKMSNVPPPPPVVQEKTAIDAGAITLMERERITEIYVMTDVGPQDIDEITISPVHPTEPELEFSEPPRSEEKPHAILPINHAMPEKLNLQVSLVPAEIDEIPVMDFEKPIVAPPQPSQPPRPTSTAMVPASRQSNISSIEDELRRSSFLVRVARRSLDSLKSSKSRGRITNGGVELVDKRRVHHCQLCQIPFSKIRLSKAAQKHHCGRCGKVICTSCSPSRGFSSHRRTDRVCLRCVS